MGVARRHDDRRGDLGAVGQCDAADAFTAAHDRVDLALGPQHAACGLERAEQRGGYLAAAADRSADLGDVAHRVGQRAEPAAGHLGRDAPHHRARHGRRSEDRVLVEERPQHVGGAAPRPAQQRARPAESPPQRELRQAGHGRRLRGGFEDHAYRRHRSSRVAPIAVDLGGEVTSDVVEGGLEVVVVRPSLAGCRTGPREVVLGRLDVDVLEPQLPKTEFLDHRGGPEREVVAVADVHGGAGELLARCGAPDVGARLDEQRRHAAAGEIGSGHQSVVPGPDHDRVEVAAGCVGGRCGRHARQSLASSMSWA